MITGAHPGAVAAREKLARHRRTSYAVWEITLRCRLNCRHCGSRAGRARPDELTTGEALDLIEQLAEVGIREVTLAGGEPLLRPDWPIITRAIDEAGMLCSILSGGYDVTAEAALKMVENGVAAVSVSVDGLEESHVALRGKADGWRRCFEAFGHFRDVGLPFSCNTQLNRLTVPDLPRLYELLRDAGIGSWQLQTTVPMGNAADCADLILQPCEMGDVHAVLARLVDRGRRDGIRVAPADCIGYFGPFEETLRAPSGGTWLGCQAGLCAVGIEADGAIKGCLSLPTDEYIGGNIRERSLREILETSPLRLNEGGGTPRGRRHLWGFCAECEHGDLCRGGCSNTAHVLFGRRGNNPYCHHRILALARRGIRERVALEERAGDGPFSIGRFALIEEPLDAPWPDDDPLRFEVVRTIVRFRGGPGKEDGPWKSIC